MKMMNVTKVICVFVICASVRHVKAFCGPNQLQMSKDDRIRLPVMSKNISTECVWLVTASNSTRFEIDVSTFNMAGQLIVGNGHTSNDFDSIFTTIEGANTSLTLVSSGNTMWIKYLATDVSKANHQYRITLDVYSDLYSGIDCLFRCQCIQLESDLEVHCVLGWTIKTIAQLPGYVINLTLSGGRMTTLGERVFSRLSKLRTLSLIENALGVIADNTFEGLPNLNMLNLSSNAIYDLHLGAFNGLQNLTLLDLRVNQLKDILPDRFTRLHGMEKLYLHNNIIETIPVGFCETIQVRRPFFLRLDGNKITDIAPNTFRGCETIITLKLSRNRIKHLRSGSLHGLTDMFSLELSKNNIATIDEGAFTNLTSLRMLRIKANHIETFASGSFTGLSNLILLDLRNNPWLNIEKYAFMGMPNLQFLFLVRFPIDQNKGILELKCLDGLNSLEHMFVDDHRLCCFMPDSCKPQTPKPTFHTCKRLMPNDILRTLLWILGISALMGNMYVIVLRCKEKTVRNPTQAILILNLAISDLLMGLYMLIIAGADVHFGDEFFVFAEIWKSSGTCIFAGLVSLYSSEASVLFIVLISLDRLLCVALPFGKKRMTVYIAKVCCMLVWISVTGIGVTAVILQVASTNVYDLATVCVGIPLVNTKTVNTSLLSTENDLRTVETVNTGTASTWQFAIAIYLGLNFIAFIVVLICYISIGAIVAVKLPSKQLAQRKDRSRELKMAGKMALIVLTDFCCWMPVIILGILVQSGRVEDVPSDTYAWLVALVLPLNSALNPYIYTISTEITRIKHQRREKKEEYKLRKTTNSHTMNSNVNTKTSRFTNL